MENQTVNSDYSLVNVDDKGTQPVPSPSSGDYSIVDAPGGKTVGAIDLFDFDPFHGRAGIGILVHHPDDRSKGFATAALRIMIRYSFEKLQLHQLYANILTDNEESLKLFLKAGFVLAGTKKDWVREGENWKDEHLLQLVIS